MGTIYKKICESGKIYYGSFSGTWEKRVSSGWSETTCRYFINPQHEFIEIVIGDVKDLVDREDWYIQNYECVNKKGKYTHLTTAEYKKQYRIKNIDTIKEKAKENYYKHRDKRIEYYNKNGDNIQKDM